jgi:hypothetical protein
MNPNLTSAVSELSKGRTERSNKSSLRTFVPNLIARVWSWFGKLVSSAFVRVLMIFIVGFAAGIAWQSYGGAARKAIAGWSPHLGWLAPAAVPSGTSPEGGTSPERLKATTLALAAARQSLDKLANEISKLEAQGRDVPRRRASR